MWHLTANGRAHTRYSLCLAVVACVHRQPNDVGEDGNHHPVVAAVGRQHERRWLRCPASADAASARRTHYA